MTCKTIRDLPTHICWVKVHIPTIAKIDPATTIQKYYKTWDNASSIKLRTLYSNIQISPSVTTRLIPSLLSFRKQENKSSQIDFRIYFSSWVKTFGNIFAQIFPRVASCRRSLLLIFNSSDNALMLRRCLTRDQRAQRKVYGDTPAIFGGFSKVFRQIYLKSESQHVACNVDYSFSRHHYKSFFQKIRIKHKAEYAVKFNFRLKLKEKYGFQDRCWQTTQYY